MEHDAFCHVFDALDGITLGIFLGITTANEHHTDGSTLVESYISASDVALRHALEEVNDVGFEPKHHAFRFGVAHSAVVFDNHWVAFHVDKSEENETLIVYSLFGQSVYRGANDALFHLLHPLWGGERHGTNAAHTACVKACIVFANALIVLSLGQNLIVFAVG